MDTNVEDLNLATERLEAVRIESEPVIARLRQELEQIETDPAAHRHAKRTLRALASVQARAFAVQQTIATARIRAERAAGVVLRGMDKA